jgi:hypothetical protein
MHEVYMIIQIQYNFLGYKLFEAISVILLNSNSQLQQGFSLALSTVVLHHSHNNDL